MIDNEVPVLRREDLITILEQLFKFSQEDDNAIKRKDDGLYVQDLNSYMSNHINDSSIHATEEERAILNNFSIKDGILYYKEKQISVDVSEDSTNGIVITSDGLYTENLKPTLESHINNTDIHLTENDINNIKSLYQETKDYVTKTLSGVIIYDWQIVTQLPIDNILNTRLYFLKETMPDSGEEYYIRYVYKDKWIPLDITKESYKLFARQEDLEENYALKESLHNHENKEIIDKFGFENETLLFDNKNIFNYQISEDENNALVLGSDNKLYIKNLEDRVKELEKQSYLTKTELLNTQCNENIVYELSDDINNYSFINVFYYLLPDDNTLSPYDAKSEMLDVENLNYLYENNIDYILEHDYGFSTYNTKIRFNNNKLQVTYYNHVCIYKITGVN